MDKLILEHFDQEAIIPVLFVVGGLVVTNFLLKVLVAAYRSLLRPSKNLTKYGKWAVVTGATDGIGKAMSFELAKRGMNVLLISRTQSKLDDVAKEISGKYPSIKTKTLSIDYSNFDEEKQKLVKDTISQLDDSFGVLINNVGVSYQFPMYFHELEDYEVTNLVELNVNSTTYMTRIALPIMLAQGKGCILNIASGAGRTQSPLLAQYSAAKAYIEKFTTSLHTEYKPKGIDIQVQTPYFIVSKLSKFKRSSIFVPTAESYAKRACNRLGYEAIAQPYWAHAFVSYIFDYIVPTGILGGRLLKMHLGLRFRGFRKRERDAAAEKDKNN